MGKTAQRILVILVAIITVFSIFSFYKLREIRNYTMMTESWLTDIDYKLNDINNNVDEIRILWWPWGSTSYPTNIFNLIDEIAENVNDINKTLSGINNRRIDFTTLYLNANKDKLNNYLNSIAK